MEASVSLYFLQELTSFFVAFVVFASETNETHVDLIRDLEARRSSDKMLEVTSQRDILPDSLSQSFCSKGAYDEPEFQRSEPSAQRDLPMAIIGNAAVLVGVAQIHWIDAKSRLDSTRIAEPQSGTVEIHWQPLMRIKIERASKFDAVKMMP